MAGKLIGRAILNTANLTLQTITVGNSTINATVNSTAVIVGNVTITSSQITVGNSTVNTVIGQTGSLSGNGALLSSVNAIALQGNSVNDILIAANTAANTLANAAYTNAIQYSGNAAQAFSNAATRADSAYTNAVAYAASNTYVNNTFLPKAAEACC